MKMHKSLLLSILVILIATSSSGRAAKSKQNEQLSVCIAFDGLAAPGCDRNCTHLHRNPKEEAVGLFARLGGSPQLCFCCYRCGGHLSNRCKLPSFTLLKKDEDPSVCNDYCRVTYPNGLGMSTSYNFGTVCQCDYDC